LDYQSFEGADGSEFDESGVSANASLDYKLTDTLTLNAGVASSWGGYELGEAAIINYTADWNYDGFATSRSNSARIGLRYETGAWAVSGALFNTDIRDLAAVLPSSGERGALSDMTSRGFDGSITYTGQSGFAKLNYTYADVELDGDDISSTAYYYGRPVGHIIALSGAYDLSTQWRVGGSAEIALEDNETSYDLPGYEVVNAYVSYKPAKLDGLELRLDVENLFDQTYVSRSSDGVGLANVVALNEPGRTISLTANMRF
jgi:hemoglobin/transferrin/lactoferrin receptor protein